MAEFGKGAGESAEPGSAVSAAMFVLSGMNRSASINSPAASKPSQTDRETARPAWFRVRRGVTGQ